MPRSMLLVGGSGGLGKGILPILNNKYNVYSTSSAELDIRWAKDVKAFFDNTNTPDILVFLSVINFDATIHKLDPVEVTKQIDVSCRGFSHVLRYCLPGMRANKYGRIIYISSVLSERPIPGTGIYAASKAFNDTLVKVAAVENAKYGITCNSIRLGYFDAGLTYKVPENILANVLETIPLKRLGTMQELVNTIDFIVNTEYLTGVNLSLSGGLNIC